MTKVLQRRIFAVFLLLGINGLILWVSFVLRQSVVDSWKKGPLIDPTAPYSAENAQLFFAIGMCATLNIYFVILASAPRWRSQKIFSFLALFGAMAATELGISLYLAHYQVTYFRPHPTLHWSCRANLKAFNNHRGGGTLNTNEFGMREVWEEQEKPAGQFRILVLGDSSNFGHGVEGDEMWSAQLQEILQPLTPLDIRVLNGACPGWTTFQALEVVQSYGGAYQPDLILAGFNNDSGPDFQTDRSRVSTSAFAQTINKWLFRSELYILSREAVLSILRRSSAQSQKAYQVRLAGETSSYGKLSGEESLQLVQRVPLLELQENIRRLKSLTAEKQGQFVWINMPINRREVDYVARYVDWNYRKTIDELTKKEDIQLIDVDAYWLRSREDGLHISGHVFHPNRAGHTRMAEQIASELIQKNRIPGVKKNVVVNAPPLASDTEVLRFGFSTKTPIHSQLGFVLLSHPELQEKHGLRLILSAYDSGKEQGKDVKDQKLDAWFSCAIPAVHMLDSRPDARIVGSVGALGRIAVVAKSGIHSFAQLKGQRIGLVKGSTPDLYWNSKWFRELRRANIEYLQTEELEEALQEGRVDAVVSWDPWIAEWMLRHPEWQVLREEAFHSVLNVGSIWALGDPQAEVPRVKRLLSLLNEAMQLLKKEPISYHYEAAALGGWSLETVEKTVSMNQNFTGQNMDMSLSSVIRAEMESAIRFVHPRLQSRDRFFGEYLVEGRFPPGKVPPEELSGKEGK